MRHNHDHAKKLTSSNNNNNNNNSNSGCHNEQYIPFCHADTAFNYYTNVGVIGSQWNLSKSPSHRNATAAKSSSPAKSHIVPRQIICRPKYASVPVSAEPPIPFPADGSYESGYTPRKMVSVATARANNNAGNTYQQLRHPSDYYLGGSTAMRQQYGHSNSAPATQELTKYSPVATEKDMLKRQIRARSHCEYLDEGSSYTHRRAPVMESAWSTVM
ncbi:hypothetical protein KR222_006139 [Zaprionus bogoriensis]|nr:hypothetical protein KR222_006139 [Zaprionus bogoriensis]